MRAISQNPASVLIVEDDEFTSQLLQFMLERERYVVHLVSDGHAAKAYIENNAPPTLVLMDVMLPFIDGFELLRMMRSLPGWAKTRIIMLSAKTEGSDIARALDAGADDYLVKPFKPEELFARLRRYSPARGSVG
jgi:DNA-binding response OmpR family regulator